MSADSSPVSIRPSSTWWTRLRFTPLRDLVRLRVTGRLDLDGAVAFAALPENLHDLIRRVVRRTRLWRLERVEVARELAAHFRDGLDAGASAARLVELFGDPAQAARLIRRAKKRTRPPAWRWSARAAGALGCVVLGFVLLYAFLAARVFLAEPTIAHDYLADVNEPVQALAESERAWPVYRDAMLALPPAPRVSNRTVLRPGIPEWETIATYLEQNAATIGQVRAAAAMPGIGYEYAYTTRDADAALFGPVTAQGGNDEGGLYGVLLPHLAKLRELARVVRADGLRAAAAGDGATVLADVEALLGMGRQACDGAFLIDQLVGLSIARSGVDLAGLVVAEWSEALTDTQLRNLAHVLETGAPGGRWAIDFSGERDGFEDLLQRIYTDDGHGDGRLTASGFRLLQSWAGRSVLGVESHDDLAASLLLPAVSLIDAGRAGMRAEYQRLLGLLEQHRDQPLWERGRDPIDAELEPIMGDPIAVSRYFMVTVFLPAIGKADLSAVKLNFERDVVQTAIALTLYRRQAGDWPASLDDLVPGMLPAVPIDIFDGRPLKYRPGESRPFLYSSGSDRDDDGAPDHGRDQGQHFWRTSTWYPPEELERARDGDWIVWPPVPPSPLPPSPDGPDTPAWEFRARQTD